MAGKRNKSPAQNGSGRGVKSNYLVSTDQRRLDLNVIHSFLRATYWAKELPRRVMEKSLKHSLCFGAFWRGQQIGFGRVVTDYATFAYIADVFVLPEHRGRGVAKRILRAMLSHSELQGLRRFLLATADAHKLYQQFGFKPLAHPEHFLTIHKPDIYRTKSQTRNSSTLRSKLATEDGKPRTRN